MPDPPRPRFADNWITVKWLGRLVEFQAALEYGQLTACRFGLLGLPGRAGGQGALTIHARNACQWGQGGFAQGDDNLGD